jgi:hypothetical protein
MNTAPLEIERFRAQIILRQRGTKSVAELFAHIFAWDGATPYIFEYTNGRKKQLSVRCIKNYYKFIFWDFISRYLFKRENKKMLFRNRFI